MEGFWITGTFGLTFLTIFGALDIITRTFPHLIISRFPLLIGRVIHVDQDHRVALAVGDVTAQRPFMRRENHPDDGTKSNHRFIFSKRGGFRCVMLAVTPPGNNAEAQYFEVPLSPGGDVKLRDSDELYVRLRVAADASGGTGLSVYAQWVRGENDILGSPLPVRSPTDREVGCSGSPSPDTRTWIAPLPTFLARLFGLSSAQAQQYAPSPAQLQQLPPAAVGKLLESEDPFVRRQTRQNLGAVGQPAEATFSALLGEPNYRLQLGTLVAIQTMSVEERRQLSPETWKQVEALRNLPDSTMRRTAQELLAAR